MTIVLPGNQVVCLFVQGLFVGFGSRSARVKAAVEALSSPESPVLGKDPKIATELTLAAEVDRGLLVVALCTEREEPSVVET